MWFLARPRGRLQLRGTFLSLWDDILPVIPEQQWRENLALVAAWLAEFGGRANAEPPHIQWQSPSRISESPSALADTGDADESATSTDGASTPWRPTDLADVQAEGSRADTPPTDAYVRGTPTPELAADATLPDPASRRSAIEANQPPPERVDVERPDDLAASTDSPMANPQAADRSSGDTSHANSASGEGANGGWPVSQREPAETENEPNATADTPTDNESDETATSVASDSAAQTPARP
jgi:hypothetical protein